MKRKSALNIIMQWHLLPVLILCTFSTLAGTIPETPGADDIVIITNPSSGISQASASDIRRVFLGLQSSIDGQAVSGIITLRSGDTHKLFLQRYVNKGEAAFRNYWKRLVFTGKGSMPRMLDDEAEMISVIARTRGAIGYVNASSLNGSVKVIRIQD